MPRPLVLALLVAAAAGCMAIENRLLFHPVRSGGASTSELPPPVRDLELHTPEGTRVSARWCPRPAAQGAILYCPGNAGNLDHRARLVRELSERLQTSVLIFDYPGYGRSEGKPSEAGCYAAAHAAYQWLVAEQNIPADQIVIYGESLGGAVGIELASRVPHRALVLARTFASLPDVAQAHFSAPVSSLASQRFDSVSRIERCPRPIFIAQADRDRVIPYHQGERLRDACRGKVELHRLRGLDHNDPLPLEFYTRLRDFLQTEAPLPSR